jgi:hypothetical protein
VGWPLLIKGGEVHVATAAWGGSGDDGGVASRAKGETLIDLEPVLMQAVLEFSAPAESKKPQEAIAVGQLVELALDGAGRTFTIDVPNAGEYALFTEHHPEEFEAKLLDVNGEITPRFEKAFTPDDEHDAEVSSVGIDVVTLKHHRMPLRTMRYQTYGPLLAYGCAEGKIAIWRPEKRTLPDVTADMGAPITDLAWCAGTRHLGAATEDGRVVALQVGTPA